jgi:outer membrane murein-binding lipoprotein Lpp
MGEQARVAAVIGHARRAHSLRSRRYSRSSLPNRKSCAAGYRWRTRRNDTTTKRLAELNARDHQLEQRMAELRDELAAAQREAVSAATIQRDVALFDPPDGDHCRALVAP